MEATFSSWFLGPYKVSKIGYGLFLYALQPAERTSISFMGAIYGCNTLFSKLSLTYGVETVETLVGRDNIGQLSVSPQC